MTIVALMKRFIVSLNEIEVLMKGKIVEHENNHSYGHFKYEVPVECLSGFYNRL